MALTLNWTSMLFLANNHGALTNGDLGVDSARYHRLDGNRREYGSHTRALRQSLGLDRRNRWTGKSACALRAWRPTNPCSLKRKAAAVRLKTSRARSAIDAVDGSPTGT